MIITQHESFKKNHDQKLNLDLKTKLQDMKTLIFKRNKQFLLNYTKNLSKEITVHHHHQQSQVPRRHLKYFYNTIICLKAKLFISTVSHKFDGSISHDVYFLSLTFKNTIKHNKNIK